MAKEPFTLPRVSVGTSGWSYPSWRPGFYPAGTDPAGFLAFYADRFPTVELNTTGYRLPAEDQFRRWAEQVPDGFEFAPKLPGHRLRGLDEFASRAHALDLEHPSWAGIEERLALAGAVRVNDLDHPAPFRYLRRREPPDAEFAAKIRAATEPVYVYFRHDEAPDAPAHAARLRELLSGG